MYQPVCVLAAGAELNVFSFLSEKPQTGQQLADQLGVDVRALTVLLDGLTALEMLIKKEGRYEAPLEVAELLTETSDKSLLSAVRHQANCLRRWVQLAKVVQTGQPAERVFSIRGAEEDQAAFIRAMHSFSQASADMVVKDISPLSFRHLLDVGGASGTWTMAFLWAFPAARATIFDLPEVIPKARRRLEQAGFLERIDLVGGDFYEEDLPPGADLAWLGAIAHQNSREQNRSLFAKVYAALEPGGIVLVRDVVMDPSRIRPSGGALFAINMLVATEGGGTYTFAEYKEDLTAAGFGQAELIRQDESMNSVIRAEKMIKTNNG